MNSKEVKTIREAYLEVYEQIKVPSGASDKEVLRGLIPKGEKVHEVPKKVKAAEEVDIYDQVLEYLLNEGYSEEESKQIMIEIINEAGLGSLIKGAKAVAGFVAKRAKTPLRTAATDSLITSTALNPVSTAKIAKNIAKSTPSPAPIVRTVKPTSVRTAPKGANKITTNVWNEPTAPSSRINPSKPSGPKVSSTKALPSTPSRPALPSAGKTSASVKAPKPTFKPEALPKATKSAEPAGALVSTRAPKPTFKPEALPKTVKSAEPAGALVRTKVPKPTFKPEALPKATKSAEPAGALVSTRAPKPTFKPEALPKTVKSAEPAGALVRTKVPKPTFKPEALPKATKSAEPAGALVSTRAPKPPKPIYPKIKGTSSEPGGALVSTRAPKPTFKPEALPKAIKSAEPGGALVRTKAPKPTSKTSTSGGGGKTPKGSGLTQTVRATLSPAEKTGNMKYPGLEKYATGSSSSGGPSKSPISSLSRNLKTAGIVGAAAAGTAAVDQGLKSEKSRRDAELRKNVKTNVYNTIDAPSIDKPTGQIRSRLKVGSRKIGSTFDDAFREAKRKEKEAKRIGDPVKTTFTYGGKEYSTKMKEENLINYLLDGGFATDEKSAEAIISVMSEEWKQNVIEGLTPLGIKTAGVVDDQRRGSTRDKDLKGTRDALDKMKAYPNGFPSVKGV